MGADALICSSPPFLLDATFPNIQTYLWDNGEVSAQIAIPNAFTPNGDGINDLFYPLGTFFNVLRIRIYNRWRQLVYDRENDIEGWDGTYTSGKLAHSDVYLYQIEYEENLTGIIKKATGELVLLR